MLAIWLHTVFGFRFYHTLRQAGPWRTAFFAVYIVLVGVLAFNIYFAWQVHQKLPAFLRSVPELSFEKGHLISPTDQTAIFIPGTEYKIVLDAQAANPPTSQEFLNRKIVAFVAGDAFYMPSVAGVNKQTFPSSFTLKLTQQKLFGYAPQVRGFLQSVAFVGAILGSVVFFALSWLLAAAVLFFWRGILRRLDVSTRTLWKWAVFLQGPALVLWLVNLFGQVPLFTFALFILFNIYVQQIFNTLPDMRGNHAA